jgi:GT2 family glycosyltransferase
MTDAPSGRGLLSVVTPTHRRAAHLKLLLDSLAAQTLGHDDFEVIVIDDASSDETPELLDRAVQKLPNLRYETLRVNSGPAQARNRGVELARGRVIVFLDDDVAAAPDLLAVHARFHEQRGDDLSALLGRVDWHPDLKITPFMRWLDSAGLQFAYDTWLEEGEVDRPYRAFYMANISIPRRAILDAGGFDERFPFPAFEDYELGWRLVRGGVRMWYLPRARAFHTRSIDLRTFRRRMRMVARSSDILLAKHPDFPLAQSLLRDRLSRASRLKAFAYAPVARLIGDEARLGPVYRELVADAYAEGKRLGAEPHGTDGSRTGREEASSGSSS